MYSKGICYEFRIVSKFPLSQAMFTIESQNQGILVSFLACRCGFGSYNNGHLLPYPPIPMSKQDLINAIADAAGITKRAASDALEAFIGTVTKELKKGNNVTVTGFGTYRISKRQARTGVNPRNPSQKIQIPAMKVPSFKAGKTLKDAVR